MKLRQEFSAGKMTAVGHTLSTPSKRGEKDTYHVIGMVKDFHFRSLHERISPLVMVFAPDPAGDCKIENKRCSRINSTLKNMDRLWG